MARDAIAKLYDLFRDLDRRIGLFDKKIDRIFHESEACQRIAKIKGVGPKTATAIVAAIGDGSERSRRSLRTKENGFVLQFLSLCPMRL